MRVTMIGHSTVLIEAVDKRILTDPYFGSWGNPAYARIAPPFKTREELKGVNLVLVSHNHWDHTDRRFFRTLGANVPVLAPRAGAWLTRLKGARNVMGVGKWEQKQFGALRVTAVPASHIAVTRGYVIEAEGKSIYFAGDTYSRGFMKEIGARFKLDLALLPVATFRIPMTMGEKSAVRAVEALSPQTVIPIHLGIVPRSPLLRTHESAEGFRKRIHDAGLRTEVRILREGESWER
ncbi:MAG TPA: MBL fold metallo-hydrolase [Terriglobia bacterium]|nr:MBL fold metallo-hydrolase [Terriglobia bacterium]